MNAHHEAHGGAFTHRRFWVSGDDGEPCEASWEDLAAVNEAATMAAIAELEVGEETVLGMCDRVWRSV